MLKISIDAPSPSSSTSAAVRDVPLATGTNCIPFFSFTSPERECMEYCATATNDPSADMMETSSNFFIMIGLTGGVKDLV